AILLPSGSRLADRLRGEGFGGALIFLGASDSIAALLDALGGAAATRPAAPVTAAATAARPTPNIPSSATPSEARPAGTATPAGARVFDRYFSSSRPTPSPTPR
ncbi:MAG TPA: hypothetical protein VLE54_07975, partial [Thermoanaerobaculia bacterium]|nr:hypothetical protein [Thermoanaerobaculia bacterium]